MSTGIVILIVVVLLALWIAGTYNHYVRLRNRAKEAWADIDVQLKRRYDLIPNLVNTVKGYAQHESTAFEKVTQARAQAMGAGTVATKAAAESTLSNALHGIVAIAEAYPELKANQNFLALQNELSDTENKIQAARRFYNTNVRDLNTGIESFPGNVVAKLGQFEKMEYFELSGADEAARKPVSVSF